MFEMKDKPEKYQLIVKMSKPLDKKLPISKEEKNGSGKFYVEKHL